MDGRIRRGFATALFVGLAMATAGVGTARAEATTATTYVAQPDAGVVVVTIESTTDALSIPSIAEDVVVTLDDAPVEPALRPNGPVTGLGLPGTGRVRVVFSLPDGAGDGAIRANPAHVAFPTWAWGADGDAAVTIRVPSDFAIKVDGAVLETAQEPGWTVMSAPVVADIAAWDVSVSARRDGALTSEIIRVGDLTYVLRSWPGEEAWAADVRSVVDLALPELADLTGIDDPLGRPLVVAQSTDPQRNGFDGWYVAATDTVEVGADPDPRVLVHEASHAWFNDLLVDERWLAEGLAETYTAEVLPAVGQPSPEPDPPDPAVGPLASWEHTALVDATTVEAERAAYAASWWVMDAIVDDLGFEAMGNVIADLAADRSAYAAPGFTTTDTPADWRRFLDLAEVHGASPVVESVLADHVAPVDAVETLASRRELRARYAALVDDPLGWVPPVGVRTAMDRWEFEAAAERIDAAFVWLAERDRLVAAGADVGAMRADYQSAVVLPILAPPVEASTTSAPLADPGSRWLWAATALALAGLGGWALSRRRPGVQPIDDTPLDPARLDEVGAQLALFDLPTASGWEPFTLVDLDVLAALDAELDGIEQQVLFELPRPTGPIDAAPDPWTALLRDGGTIRF